MHVSVSKLGGKAANAAGAARAVVDYLTGQQRRDAGQRGEPSPELANDAGPGTYYADSAQAPGRWHGAGVDAMIPVERQGAVDAEMLKRVLLGQHPVTGEQLVGANGSAARSDHAGLDSIGIAQSGPGHEQLSLMQAAKLIGVEPKYLADLARKTTAARSIGGELPGTYLDAVKNDRGRWQVTRAEVERFAAVRKEPQIVLGYDLTYSVPKSVSLAWAASDDNGRKVIEDALHQAVDAAMDYMETNATVVRRGRDMVAADDMIAASFLHDTSRELEPQLHVHVVVANMATGPDGQVSALDGRATYAHAGTSGHLAEAQIQSILNQHGYAFGPTIKGIAHLADIPQTAVDAMSTRRAQILAEVDAIGVSSPHARQLAALATRAAKDTTVDRVALEAEWSKRLVDHGLTAAQLDIATSHDAPRLWTPDDTARLDIHLAGVHGVTEKTAIFDRRNVVCAIADYSSGRLRAAEVTEHADRWLGTQAVIALQADGGVAGVRGDLIGTAGRVSLAAGATQYTTPAMVRLEHQLGSYYLSGHDTGAGIVAEATLEEATAQWQRRTGFELGEDQAAMVRAITTSGDRFQAVVGPAGSGKTAALEVAARAWQSNGFDLLGASVNGTAAEVLQTSTGIESTTVAGLLVQLDHGQLRLTERSVLIVDEASTLGNRAHHRLARHIHDAGATMRTIGDPAQHGAVAAGGMWTELTKRYPDRTPELTKNRRQTSDAMEDVRLAAADYRDGRIADALERLHSADRFVHAATSAELLDNLAADWFVDWKRHTAQPDQVRPSRMLAESHSARRELNTRAQVLLRTDGILQGEGVAFGDAVFHVGDQVINRSQNRKLYPDNDPTRYLRNGTKGTVIAIDVPNQRRDGSAETTVTVDFENRGPIEVPQTWLETEIRPGLVGGLAPAYAVTTHAAQGDTFYTSRSLVTDRSSAPGQYVALTRGENELRLYAVDAAAFTGAAPAAEHELPIIDDQRPLLDRIEDQLTKPAPIEPATVADPNLARVLALREQPLRWLESQPGPEAARAATDVIDRAHAALAADPPASLVALIGTKPPEPDQHWTHAVREVAVVTERWPEHAAATLHNQLHRPSPATPEQTADYARMGDALVAARAANHGHLPSEQLDKARREIQGRLVGMEAPRADVRAGIISELERDVERQQGSVDRLGVAHQRASEPRARKKDPDQPELLRRDLVAAQQQLGVAKANLADRRVAHAQPDTNVAARTRLRFEVRVIDRIRQSRPAPGRLTIEHQRSRSLGR